MALTGNELLTVLGSISGSPSATTTKISLSAISSSPTNYIFLVQKVLPDGKTPSSKQIYAKLSDIPNLNANDIILVEGILVNGLLSGETIQITGSQLKTFYSQTVPVPSGFSWTSPPITITRTNGVLATNFNITSLVPAITTTYYVDPINGSNANSGLTRLLPLKSLSTALAKSDVDQIRIINNNSTFIARASAGWNNVQASRSISVVNEGPGAFISAQSASSVPATFTLTSGNTYQTALTSANSSGVADASFATRPYCFVSGGIGYVVNDTITLPNGAVLTVGSVGTGGVLEAAAVTTRPKTLVAAGTMRQSSTSGVGLGATWNNIGGVPLVYDVLILGTSSASVQATPGTWFNDGTNTYIQTLDSRNLIGDTNIIIGNTTNNGRFGATVNNLTLYVSGIDFVCGSSPFLALTALAANTGTLAFLNCSFQGSGGTSNGYAMQGLLAVYSQNCGAYFNKSDGFNYHSFQSDGTTTGTSPSWIEIGNVSMGNGTTGSTGVSDNASTSHDFCQGIRLNGIYCNSDDRVLAETNSAQTWNLGCTVGQAVKQQAGEETIAALLTSKMWIDTVVALPNGVNPSWISAQSATLNYYNSGTVVNAGTGEATGTVQAYVGQP